MQHYIALISNEKTETRIHTSALTPQAAITNICEAEKCDKDDIEKMWIEGQEEPAESRICDHCGSLMTEGYCIEAEEYYCSDLCLNKHISKGRYLELYDNGNGDSYWTSWK